MTNFCLDQWHGEAFDLPLCVGSGQSFRWTSPRDGSFIGVDGLAWFRVANGSVESNKPQDAFIQLFRLDEDSAALMADLLAKGPELAPYLEAVRGLRLMRPSDPVETLFSFLCTANNHIARIGGMVRHLATYGPRMAEIDGIALHRFPPIDVIAEISEASLRSNGFGYRGASIPLVAKELLLRGGDSYLRDLKGGSYRDAHAELVTIKSIGRKLADCICLFAFHHEEATPIDTHVWQAATRLYFPEWRDSALTEKKYEHVGKFLRERFGSHAGWAQQFLFYENVVNWRKRNANIPP